MIRVSSRCLGDHFSASSTLFSCQPCWDWPGEHKHALNAGERFFQRRAVSQFYSKPAPSCRTGTECEGQETVVHDPSSANGRNLRVAVIFGRRGPLRARPLDRTAMSLVVAKHTV